MIAVLAFAIGASLLVVQAGAGPLFLWTESAFSERVQRECVDAASGHRELALFHIATDEVTPAPPVRSRNHSNDRKPVPFQA